VAGGGHSRPIGPDGRNSKAEPPGPGCQNRAALSSGARPTAQAGGPSSVRPGGWHQGGPRGRPDRVPVWPASGGQRLPRPSKAGTGLDSGIATTHKPTAAGLSKRPVAVPGRCGPRQLSSGLNRLGKMPSVAQGPPAGLQRQHHRSKQRRGRSKSSWKLQRLPGSGAIVPGPPSPKHPEPGWHAQGAFQAIAAVAEGPGSKAVPGGEQGGAGRARRCAGPGGGRVGQGIEAVSLTTGPPRAASGNMAMAAPARPVSTPAAAQTPSPPEAIRGSSAAPQNRRWRWRPGHAS